MSRLAESSLPVIQKAEQIVRKAAVANVLRIKSRKRSDRPRQSDLT